MKIANPIYDTFFKFMIENINSARYIIQSVLGQKLLKLEAIPQEKTLLIGSKLNTLRFDYAAVIKQENGSIKKVLIELQKGKDKIDIGRFRRYLAKNYKEENQFDDKMHYLPVIAIYFLGFNLDNPCPSIQAKISLTNFSTGQIIQDYDDDFIQKLTHEGYFIQINRIKSNAQDDFSKKFQIFNQEFIDVHADKIGNGNKNYNNGILDFPDELITEENREIIMELSQVLLNEEAMDTFIEERSLEKIIKQDADQSFNQGKAEGEAIGIEKGKAEGEAIGIEKGKAEIAKGMKQEGLTTEIIAKITGLSLEQINAL